MRLRVTAVYGEDEVSFPMNVGDGRKNFKWLGLTVAQRFCQRAQHGRTRTRELVPLAPFPSFLVPTLVHSSDEGFHDPEDILVESLVEEQDVRVVLGHMQAVDARAEPIISPWTLVAFRQGKSWEGKRHHAEAEVEEEHERRRSSDALGETEEKMRTMRAKAELMRDIMHYQVVSETRTLQGFELDWNRMHLHARLDSLVHQPEDQDEIRAKLLENYNLLTELFRSFASQGSVGSALTRMDYREYVNALNMMEVRCVLPETLLLQHMFVDCFDDAIAESQRLLLSMELPDFLLLLIQLSYALYIDRHINRHLPAIPWASIGRRRSVLLNNSTGGCGVTIAQALDSLLREYILPYAQTHLTTYVVKQALASDAVLATLGDLHDQLLKVYRTYARLTPGAYIYQSLMDMREFMTACKDAKLLDKDFDERTTPIALREVKMAFAFSQNTTPAPPPPKEEREEEEEERFGLPGEGDDEEQLSYPEFIEGVARLGLLRYANEERYTVLEKIRAGAKAMAALSHHATSKRKGPATAAGHSEA